MIKIINEDRKVLGSLYVIIPSDFSDLIGMCEGDASELLARMIPIGYEDELMDHLVEVFPDGVNIRDLNDYLSKEQDVIYQALGLSEDGEVLDEDTVRKSNGKWTNRGDDGKEHGEFKTKKEADAQRRAMYANGYKGEDLGYDNSEDTDIEYCPSCGSPRFNSKTGLCVDCGYDEKSWGDTSTDDYLD